MERSLRGHVPALDGARGIAILLVVCVHAYLRPTGGYLGVDVFFVLSGFLITTLLLREYERTGRVSLGGFYRRRALRLLPALALFLAGFAVVTAISLHAAGTPWSVHSAIAMPILESAFYVSNLVLTFNGSLPPAIRQLWSLAAEEQFYLLWPLALLFLLRRRVTPRLLAAMLVTAIAAVATARFALEVAGVNRVGLYFAPLSSADALLVGCLFAVWFVHGTGPAVIRSRDFRRVVTPILLAGAAAQVWTIGDWSDPTLYRWVMPVFALECGFLLFAATTAPSSLLARGLSLPPLRYLGRISYGLYLWHPLTLWFTFYVWSLLPGVRMTKTEAVLLAIAVSVVSYNVVELRFLRRKQRLETTSVVPDEVTGPAVAVV